MKAKRVGTNRRTSHAVYNTQHLFSIETLKGAFRDRDYLTWDEAALPCQKMLLGFCRMWPPSPNSTRTSEYYTRLLATACFSFAPGVPYKLGRCMVPYQARS